MNYLLVENKQTVLLGPISWKPRFIQSEFDDLEVNFTVPPVEQGYIKVNDTYELFPVSDATGPAIDSTYEQMVGPFYTYGADSATATYTSQPLPTEVIRSKLKAQAADERYTRECAGTKVTLSGVDYSVATDRVSNTQFDYLLATIGSDSVNWKFDQGFKSLNAADVAAIVAAVKGHVQAQFDWEKSIHDAVDAASTVEGFKAIVIVTPVIQPGQVN